MLALLARGHCGHWVLCVLWAQMALLDVGTDDTEVAVGNVGTVGLIGPAGTMAADDYGH